MLGRKLHCGTFKTKESRAGLVRVPLFWKSHCVICISSIIYNLYLCPANNSKVNILESYLSEFLNLTLNRLKCMEGLFANFISASFLHRAKERGTGYGSGSAE